MSEQFPGTVSVGFAGLFAPKATPVAIVQKVASDVQNIVADPSFQQAVVDKGSVPDLRTKEQWTIFLADLTTKYSDLVKSGKVKVAE